MKNSTIIALLCVTLLAIAAVEPAFAAPGGKIAKAAFESFWGRIGLGLLTIIFLPLIIYTIFKEKLAERKARKDLAFMARHSAKFEWLKVQERVKDCFHRVHSSWQDEDLSQVSSWMTSWYWQSQQLVHLNRWKKEGLINVCNVKKITDIKPILLAHRNSGAEHEDSVVVVSITANMNDYLEDRNTGKVVEGSKKFKEVETIWSFTMDEGEWKVSDIEEGSMSLAYARAAKDLPAIETTIVSDLRA